MIHVVSPLQFPVAMIPLLCAVTTATFAYCLYEQLPVAPNIHARSVTGTAVRSRAPTLPDMSLTRNFGGIQPGPRPCAQQLQTPQPSWAGRAHAGLQCALGSRSTS